MGSQFRPRPWGQALARHTLGVLVKRLWIAEVEGLENIPRDGSVIIASNHESYLDFLAFTSIAPRPIYYLAAEKLFRNPLWWWLLTLTGQVRLDRGRQTPLEAYKQALDVLREGEMLGVFPEGGRSRDGRLQPGHSGVAILALKSRAPVVPVGVIGSFAIWPPHRRLPRFRHAKLQIRIGAPLKLVDYEHRRYGDRELQQLTDMIMRAIAVLIGKPYAPPGHEKGREP